MRRSVRPATTVPGLKRGRSLKLRVVAEGVATLEELAFLQAHECDEAQGYYFSRPLPIEQFARLLRTGMPEPSVVVHELMLSPLASAEGRPN